MYFLAVDIGASSGRHILGNIENGKLVLQEIYRFPNSPKEKDGKLVWDIQALFSNVVNGIKECKKLGKIPYSVGIDTWGVDYALLDKNDNLIGDVISYRDNRTKVSAERTHAVIPFKDLYAKTGVQFAQFNTIYQLFDDKTTGKLDGADCVLTVPDYLHYLLCGVKANEYTNASTTGLINAKERCWDNEIIQKLGYPREIFRQIVQPGSVLGDFTKEIQEQVGFNALVVTPACHDTASAVMAVPALDENPLYISSGTWSLLGTELSSPLTSDGAMRFNMTNEGGYANTIRFLKNISGMWAIQNLKKEFNDEYSFAQIASLAKEVTGFDYRIDINDDRFLAPDSMSQEIKKCCQEMGEKVPNTIGELAHVVYNSLADLYAKTISSLEDITGKKYGVLNIVGGGCQNEYLNSLTKKATNIKVMVGPVEGTAIGNILCQAISAKRIADIRQGRQIVIDSFNVKEV